MPNESKPEFRKRKLAAYIVSDEYKQLQSAVSGTRNSILTNGQGQAGSDEDLSEYLPSGTYLLSNMTEGESPRAYWIHFRYEKIEVEQRSWYACQGGEDEKAETAASREE